MSRVDINYLLDQMKYRFKLAYHDAYEKGKRAAEYVRDNPREAATIIAAGSTFLGITHKISKDISRKNLLRKERELKELYVYDYSSHMYIRLKHKLSVEDLENVERLRRKGYSKTEALLKLNLVKK